MSMAEIMSIIFRIIRILVCDMLLPTVHYQVFSAKKCVVLLSNRYPVFVIPTVQYGTSLSASQDIITLVSGEKRNPVLNLVLG
jgi:hypothetical protein